MKVIKQNQLVRSLKKSLVHYNEQRNLCPEYSESRALFLGYISGFREALEMAEYYFKKNKR